MAITIKRITQKPIFQALIFFILTTPFVLVLSPTDADEAWLIAGYCFYGFLLINTVVLWFVDEAWRYFFHSVTFAFIYVILISFLMPILILKMDLRGSGESAMVFLFIIYHPAALLVVMLARWIHYKMS
ncbi:MAG TPA: hypothetical protein DIS90_01870 [Cytophagales bacterium]|nr:hypothetical protein [Cytophagales bacterium]